MQSLLDKHTYEHFSHIFTSAILTYPSVPCISYVGEFFHVIFFGHEPQINNPHISYERTRLEFALENFFNALKNGIN